MLPTLNKWNLLSSWPTHVLLGIVFQKGLVDPGTSHSDPAPGSAGLPARLSHAGAFEEPLKPWLADSSGSVSCSVVSDSLQPHHGL